MGSIPVSPQEVTEFRREPRSYIIHNASPEWRERMFNGTFIKFPPCDVVGPIPGRDADGDPIPGTTLVKDLFGTGGPDKEIFGDWDDKLIFDAASATKFILGIDVKTSRATSRAALGGLSLIPKHSSKERISEIVNGGRSRHMLVSGDNDRELIAAYTAKAAVHQRDGLPMPAPPKEYHEAVARENSRAAQAKKEFEATVPASLEEELVEDVEFLAYASAKAKELAEKAGKNLSASARAELAEELLKQPDVRRKLSQGWKIRQRGHMEQSTEQLAQLAQESAEVPED